MRFTLLLFFFVILIKFLSASDWQTYYEKSGFKKTPRYKETIEFCERLSSESAWVYYTGFGISPQGRELPLVIVDKDGNFSVDKVKKSKKAIILIEAGIHAGEIDGKDAGLMLIRDLVIEKKYSGLLDNTTILFIPIFNVDGHERFGPYNRFNQNGPDEMGWRVTAQNLNLNRDFLKADSPEMQAWLKLFNKWLPDLFIDCHVTDGADYQYVVTYSLEIFGNMASSITQWTKNRFLPEIEKLMKESNFPVAPYVFFRKKHNPESGVESWAATPRFAHGYAAVQNRPGLLIETHMLKNYKQRVSGTYQMLLNSIKIIYEEHKVLLKAVKEADDFTKSKEFRQQPFPLDFEMTNDSTIINFLGKKIRRQHSNISGTEWVIYEPDIKTYQIPYFNHQTPIDLVSLPEAYIIPAEWQPVIERIKLHGIDYTILTKSKTFNIKDAYKDDRFDPTTDKKTGYTTRSILCMPIREPVKEEGKTGSIIGVLQILNKINGVFTHDDEELLKSLGSQISISLVNSRLYNILEDRVSELNLMFEMEQELSRAYNQNELLQNILALISKILHVEHVLFLLSDEEGRGFPFRWTVNLNTEKIKKIYFKFDRGIWKKLISGGQIHTINEPNEETELLSKELRVDINHCLGIPLISDGKVIGVIIFINKIGKDAYFSKNDEKLTTSITGQLSRGIDNYRLKEEKMNEDRLATIGNMMSAMVHDIRTPMNNIYGFVDLISEEDEADKRREYAEIINQQIEVLTNMTTDVLDFAKGESTVLLRKYPVDRLVKEFVRFFEGDVRKKGYNFEWNADVTAMIYIDPDKLKRVFMNIMKNALEAMELDGTFSLKVTEKNGEIIFLLSDTGIGIPEEIRSNLFDSFVTSGKEGGTGLGLAIVKQVIDEHKGKIEVESVLGKGTTFKIYIPKL